MKKTVDIIGAVCSFLCILTSISGKDYTEACAWFIVLMHTLRDIIFDK